jgi:uncharacterized protein (TIGR02996 family)
MSKDDERRAFLLAICERPEDDTARLVFADWLDEQGESERAEFIRIGIELAKGVCRRPVKRKAHEQWHDCGKCEGCNFRKFAKMSRSDIRARESEILLRDDWLNATEWFRAGELELINVYNRPPRVTLGTEVPGPTRAVFRCDYARGFLSRVECTAADFLKHAAGLFAAHPIEEVRLAGKRPNEDLPNASGRIVGRRSYDWWPQADGTETDGIPEEIFDVMATIAPKRLITWPDGERCLESESVEEAVSLLSRACVKWGRRQAGLEVQPVAA